MTSSGSDLDSLVVTERDPAAEREFLKGTSEHLKHLTTLSSGFILVMVGFLERLFRAPEWRGAVPVSFVAFVGCILFAAVAQAYYVGFLNPSDDRKREVRERIAFAVTLLAWVSFLIGVISLVAFALKNFTA